MISSKNNKKSYNEILEQFKVYLKDLKPKSHKETVDKENIINNFKKTINETHKQLLKKPVNAYYTHILHQPTALRG